MVSFIFLSLLFAPKAFSSSVAEVCELKQWERGVLDPKSAICLVLAGSSTAEAQSLASGTLAILSQISDLKKDPRAGEYYQSLDQLATQLNRDNLPSDLGESAELSAFIQKFEDPSKRQNQEEYYEGIKSIMSQSPLGRKALECFYSKDETFTQSVVEFSATGETTLLGTFNIKPTEDGKFHKVMRLELKNQNPARALSVVAHEMMHACDAGAFAHDHNEITEANRVYELSQQQLEAAVSSLEDKIRQDPNRSPRSRETDLEAASWITAGWIQEEQRALFKDAQEQASFQRLIDLRNESVKVLERAQKQYAHTMALSEVKAYKLINVDYFKEVAAQSPRYFCDQLTPSVFDGGVITSFAKSRANLEAMLQDRSFIKQLIGDYSRSNGYDPHAFYQERLDEEGSRILENSLEGLQQRPLDAEFSRKLEELYQTFQK